MLSVGSYLEVGLALQLYNSLVACKAGGEDEPAVGIEIYAAAVGQVDGIAFALRNVHREHIFNLHILDAGCEFHLLLGRLQHHLSATLLCNGDGSQFRVGLIDHQRLVLGNRRVFVQEDKAYQCRSGCSGNAPPYGHTTVTARLMLLLESLIFLVHVNAGSLFLCHHLHGVDVAAILQQLLIGAQLCQLFVGNISSILYDVERFLQFFFYIVFVLHRVYAFF